jgi:hypothetical protein
MHPHRIRALLSYERFRAVLRFAPRLLERGASSFVTLLLAADAAFFKALRFMTADAAPTTSVPAITGMSFRMLISPPDLLLRWPRPGSDKTRLPRRANAALNQRPRREGVPMQRKAMLSQGYDPNAGEKRNSR